MSTPWRVPDPRVPRTFDDWSTSALKKLETAGIATSKLTEARVDLIKLYLYFSTKQKPIEVYPDRARREKFSQGLKRSFHDYPIDKEYNKRRREGEWAVEDLAKKDARHIAERTAEGKGQAPKSLPHADENVRDAIVTISRPFLEPFRLDALKSLSRDETTKLGNLRNELSAAWLSNYAAMKAEYDSQELQSMVRGMRIDLEAGAPKPKVISKICDKYRNVLSKYEHYEKKPTMNIVFLASRDAKAVWIESKKRERAGLPPATSSTSADLSDPQANCNDQVRTVLPTREFDIRALKLLTGSEMAQLTDARSELAELWPLAKDGETLDLDASRDDGCWPRVDQIEKSSIVSKYHNLFGGTEEPKLRTIENLAGDDAAAWMRANHSAAMLFPSNAIPFVAPFSNILTHWGGAHIGRIRRARLALAMEYRDCFLSSSMAQPLSDPKLQQKLLKVVSEASDSAMVRKYDYEIAQSNKAKNTKAPNIQTLAQEDAKVWLSKNTSAPQSAEPRPNTSLVDLVDSDSSSVSSSDSGSESESEDDGSIQRADRYDHKAITKLQKDVNPGRTDKTRSSTSMDPGKNGKSVAQREDTMGQNMASRSGKGAKNPQGRSESTDSLNIVDKLKLSNTAKPRFCNEMTSSPASITGKNNSAGLNRTDTMVSVERAYLTDSPSSMSSSTKGKMATKRRDTIGAPSSTTSSTTSKTVAKRPDTTKSSSTDPKKRTAIRFTSEELMELEG